ncbi:MAG: RrF2 family transcriptional regulator [Candidatus Krumholzibacteriia bacterium]
MLRITKAEEHALRLVMRLARQTDQRTLAQLAAQELLPEPTVAKLLGRLRDGGLVTAQRGRHGGYELALPPARISVAGVLGALKRPLMSPHTCQDGRRAVEPCPRLADCGLRPVWAHVAAQVTDLLNGITIADLLQAEGRVRDGIAARWPRPAAPDETLPVLDGPGS